MGSRSGDADDDLELELAERLRVAVGAFVRQVRVLDTTSPGQAAVLGQLARDGDCSITDLAGREGVRHQSMARTVKLLADQGWVGVTIDQRDRRRVTVHLNPAGAARLNTERNRRATGVAGAIARSLDAQERAVLAQLPAILDKVGEAVRIR